MVTIEMVKYLKNHYIEFLIILFILLSYNCSKYFLKEKVTIEKKAVVFEPIGSFNGFSIYLRYENKKIGSKFNSIADTLSKNGYRVHLENSFGEHKGDFIMYGSLNSKHVIDDIIQLCNDILKFSNIKIKRFDNQDNSYNKQEIVIQLETDFFK